MQEPTETLSADLATRYRQDLEMLIDSFSYEYCEVCGKDIDRHVLSPDMLGNPHAFCLDSEED